MRTIVGRSQPRLHGVFPPIPTPFTESDRLDRAALNANLTWWNRFDLAGIVVLGSNGEAVHLDEAEKLRLIEWVRAHTPDDRRVIAGAGLFTTRGTIALSHHVAKAGADHVLVLPPFFYRPQMTREALRDHFVRIADASPVPVLLYNMPANTGIDLETELIEVLSNHENIAGLKDSSGNVAKLAALRASVPDGFSILAGSAGFFLAALAVGADGGVLALANVAPSLCIAIERHVQSGEWNEAAHLQARVVPLNDLVTRYGGVPALKAAMDLLGLCGGPPRSPLRPLPPREIERLRDALARAAIPSAKEAA